MVLRIHASTPTGFCPEGIYLSIMPTNLLVMYFIDWIDLFFQTLMEIFYFGNVIIFVFCISLLAPGLNHPCPKLSVDVGNCLKGSELFGGIEHRNSRMSTGPGLESLVDQTISVITNDGRNIVGVLKGFDQATNIILDESHERVYSTKEGVQQLVLGLYIIRGDNISIIGELDEDLDTRLDLSKLRAHPLKPVIH
ncbi:hypothetical protein Nepgr_013123 [Nepenthes gracilis]|uniref:U6 snRNA-associated Sm-like protein LSm8 n=1 Tax=Nepenthes gracilis TaxID=150966 RepID=A0AAD3SII7_NEPGR|nr:hypothetical protein Nepgr_013123 [Nepenthes gracilis]